MTDKNLNPEFSMNPEMENSATNENTEITYDMDAMPEEIDSPESLFEGESIADFVMNDYMQKTGLADDIEAAQSLYDKQIDVITNDGATQPTPEEIAAAQEGAMHDINENWLKTGAGRVLNAFVLTSVLLGSAEAYDQSPETVTAYAMGQAHAQKERGNFGSTYSNPDAREAYNDGYAGKGWNSSGAGASALNRAGSNASTTHYGGGNFTRSQQQQHFQQPAPQQQYKQPAYQQPVYQQPAYEQAGKSKAELRKMPAYKEGERDAKNGYSLAEQYEGDELEAYEMGQTVGKKKERGGYRTDASTSNRGISKDEQRHKQREMQKQRQEQAKRDEIKRKGTSKAWYRILGGEGSANEAVREILTGVNKSTNRR